MSTPFVARALAPLWMLGALACGVDEHADPAPPPLLPARPGSAPEAPGPYAVGVTTLEVPTHGEWARALPVEVWYPATHDGASEATAYALTLGALELARLASPYGAVRDAPPDRHGAPHPVIVFSHGFGGTRLQSLYLTEHLASHGFVVAAVDHVGNTFAEQVNQAAALTPLQSAWLRPIDVTRTLDELLARNERWPGDPLALTLDPDRAGIAGHSFGGYTALRVAGASVDVAGAALLCGMPDAPALCEGWGEVPFPASARDPRFVAALAQAPGGAAVYQEDGLHDVAVPTMIQGGTVDRTTPYEPESVAPYQQLDEPAYLLGIEAAGHFSFSDMCVLLGLIDLDVEQFDDGCAADNIPDEQAHALIRRYGTAFLQVYVAGDGSYRSHLDDEAPRPAGVATFDAK